MPCFEPLEAWRGRASGPSDKGSIVWRKEDSCGIKVILPCGQCIGCRLEKSRQWAVRIMHEASMHEKNCFITLTYAPEKLPADESLDKRHFPEFMKRLRKSASHRDECGNLWHLPIRVFYCGEYGEQLSRPHYHACVFGLDFADKELMKEENGMKLWTSNGLEEIWGMGFCTIGELTFESAAYVARYVMKKVTGADAEDHYKKFRLDGTLVDVEPEFVGMSRRPGIARAWYESWRHEVFPADEVLARGFAVKPPRFYDKLLEAESPEEYEQMKKKRREEMRGDVRPAPPGRRRGEKTGGEDGGKKKKRGFEWNNTPERLKVRRKVTEARVKQLKRNI